jgi:hypothetical protein
VFEHLLQHGCFLFLLENPRFVSFVLISFLVIFE